MSREPRAILGRVPRGIRLDAEILHASVMAVEVEHRLANAIYCRLNRIARRAPERLQIAQDAVPGLRRVAAGAGRLAVKAAAGLGRVRG